MGKEEQRLPSPEYEVPPAVPAPPVSTLVPADFRSHKDLFNLTSGTSMQFMLPESIPDYRLATDHDQMLKGGTQVNLLCSANPDVRSTWDAYTRHPLYAGRYHNPLVTRQHQKNIYWEMEIREGITGDVGVGLRVPDSAHLEERRRGSAGLTPEQVVRNASKCGIFWWSEDGSVYINGEKLPDLNLGSKDTVRSIGVGAIFHYDPTFVPKKPEEKKKSRLSRWIEKRQSPVAPSAEAKDLLPVATELFFVVNGVQKMIDIRYSEMWRSYINGVYDVYPSFVVNGAGVEGQIRFGKAVDWDGEGGKTEAGYWCRGDANLPEYQGKDFKKANFTLFWGDPMMVGLSLGGATNF